MRLLVHHGKDGDIYWIIDTRAQINAAMFDLFKRLDADGCYEDEKDTWTLAHARHGDHGAVYKILKRRQDAEYERWAVLFAIDPCNPPET